MPKSTTSKTQKVDVAEKTKAVVTEKTTADVEKAKVNEVKNTVKETTKTELKEESKADVKKDAEKSGLPFTVKDGLVHVISKIRANKSVYGSSGDIIKFDEKGEADVKLIDALHFQNVPGFEFK